jgi:DNA repair protein RadC
MESNQGYSSDYEVAEIGLIYRNVSGLYERPQLNDSRAAFDLLRQCWNDHTIDLQESFKVILLNRNNRVLGIYEASVGSTCGTLVDPKLIFIAALKAVASSIIVAHNHPTGNTNPSEADRQLTTKLKAGGNLLDIKVLDHIIVTSNKYFSFADEGLM